LQCVEVTIEALPLGGDLFPDLRMPGFSDMAFKRFDRP
jgi:hypothetical protein